MTLPTDFTPLHTRLGEMFLSGSGTVHTIPTGTFDLDYAYEGRPAEQGANDALDKPWLRFKVFASNENRLMTQADQMYLDVTVEVEVGYSLDSKLLRTQRQAAQTTALRDGITIQNALTHPGNLAATEAGTETGLHSGVLRLLESPDTEVDYTTSLMTMTQVYTGIISISKS